jgi:outer membrane protein OmpA-like peptidoglycan-associated protein
MGIIQQIYQVMQPDATIKLKIVGDTDADGDDNINKAFSEKRAEAVKNALVSLYNVTPNRLSIEGKGESEPVGENNTPDGNGKNRRVEFIKQ